MGIAVLKGGYFRGGGIRCMARDRVDGNCNEFAIIEFGGRGPAEGRIGAGRKAGWRSAKGRVCARRKGGFELDVRAGLSAIFGPEKGANSLAERDNKI
jgi:hypothetical protein